ncbi:hypothetical protein BDR07DRAFT_1276885 [Suillus spraguei]|nr:hypothetical protein BDR07DRAFT_1276885 [Suillus spraguei]
MPTITPVSTSNAPSATGPYSQAIKAGEFVFVLGCIPLVPSTMQQTLEIGILIKFTLVFFEMLTAHGRSKCYILSESVLGLTF